MDTLSVENLLYRLKPVQYQKQHGDNHCRVERTGKDRPYRCRKSQRMEQKRGVYRIENIVYARKDERNQDLRDDVTPKQNAPDRPDEKARGDKEDGVYAKTSLRKQIL